jgi:hypothetical protein
MLEFGRIENTYYCSIKADFVAGRITSVVTICIQSIIQQVAVTSLRRLWLVVPLNYHCNLELANNKRTLPRFSLNIIKYVGKIGVEEWMIMDRCTHSGQSEIADHPSGITMHKRSPSCS